MEVNNLNVKIKKVSWDNLLYTLREKFKLTVDKYLNN